MLLLFLGRLAQLFRGDVALTDEQISQARTHNSFRLNSSSLQYKIRKLQEIYEKNSIPVLCLQHKSHRLVGGEIKWERGAGERRWSGRAQRAT
jgi:hypothetical protein